MSLHDEILGIECVGDHLPWSNSREAFWYGHQAARQAAAEIALKAESDFANRVAELEKALTQCVALLSHIEPEVRGGYSPDGALAQARTALNADSLRNQPHKGE